MPKNGFLMPIDDPYDFCLFNSAFRYDIPAQCFGPAPKKLARVVETVASLPHRLNNALVEVYDNNYTKMGFHSDQAQDLAPGSYIAVYSSYENPDQPPTRKLVVEEKVTGARDGGGGDSTKPFRFEVLLRHHSVVVWSLDTNRRFIHKIVLDLDKRTGQPTAPENRWLGFTMRTSDTFVTCCQNGDGDGEACVFEDGTPLVLATVEQRKQFYQMRGRENKEVNFEYPALGYTISRSDLLQPISLSQQKSPAKLPEPSESHPRVEQ